CDDLSIPHPECGASALDDEQLRVGMPVQGGTAAGRCVDEEHRHRNVVVGSDEDVRRLAVGQVVEVDDGAHGDLLAEWSDPVFLKAGRRSARGPAPSAPGRLALWT